MNTESEINAQFFPIINALADKNEAAQAAARDAYAAFFRTKRNTPAKAEAWAAYEIARDARKAAEAELNAAFDARAEAKKKLKAANRKAWFNS
jgi:hypothetical protein